MFQGMPTQRAQAIAVPLIYGMLEATCIPIYCYTAWKMGWTKAPPEEALCTVLAKSYESWHDELNHPHAGRLEESTAGAAIGVNTVKWTAKECSPTCILQQLVNDEGCSEDTESTDGLDNDLDECRTLLTKKLAYQREDTLDTDSDESFV